MKKLITYIRKLGQPGSQPQAPLLGLCHQVMIDFGFNVELAELPYWSGLCKSWPIFSGDIYFPLPGGGDNTIKRGKCGKGSAANIGERSVCTLLIIWSNIALSLIKRGWHYEI